MYRNRWHMHPRTYADWNKMLALAGEYEKLAAAKGWVPGTFWSGAVGEAPTEIMCDWDYPDLATFQREFKEYECPEMEEIFRKLDEVEKTRPVYTELLEMLTVG